MRVKSISNCKARRLRYSADNGSLRKPSVLHRGVFIDACGWLWVGKQVGATLWRNKFELTCNPQEKQPYIYMNRAWDSWEEYGCQQQMGGSHRHILC